MKRFILNFKNGDPLLATVQQAFPTAQVISCSLAPDDIVAAACKRHCYGSDDEIEIDEPAAMSEGEDGTWVQGWLFVPGVGSQYVQQNDYE